VFLYHGAASPAVGTVTGLNAGSLSNAGETESESVSSGFGAHLLGANCNFESKPKRLLCRCVFLGAVLRDENVSRLGGSGRNGTDLMFGNDILTASRSSEGGTHPAHPAGDASENFVGAAVDVDSDDDAETVDTATELRSAVTLRTAGDSDVTIPDITLDRAALGKWCYYCGHPMISSALFAGGPIAMTKVRVSAAVEATLRRRLKQIIHTIENAGPDLRQDMIDLATFIANPDTTTTTIRESVNTYLDKPFFHAPDFQAYFKDIIEVATGKVFSSTLPFETATIDLGSNCFFAANGIAFATNNHEEVVRGIRRCLFLWISQHHILTLPENAGCLRKKYSQFKNLPDLGDLLTRLITFGYHKHFPSVALVSGTRTPPGKNAPYREVAWYFLRCCAAGTARFVWRNIYSAIQLKSTLTGLGELICRLFNCIRGDFSVIEDIKKSLFAYYEREPIEFCVEVLLNVAMIVTPFAVKALIAPATDFGRAATSGALAVDKLDIVGKIPAGVIAPTGNHAKAAKEANKDALQYFVDRSMKKLSTCNSAKCRKVQNKIRNLVSDDFVASFMQNYYDTRPVV
jgi:hypothetical protein